MIGHQTSDERGVGGVGVRLACETRGLFDCVYVSSSGVDGGGLEPP